MDTGHLHLSKRVKIAKEIADKNTLNKIYLECAKLVFRKHNIEDSVLRNLLFDVEQILYYDKLYDLKHLYNDHKNSLEAISEQPLSRVAATVLSLLGSLAIDAEGILNIEDYNGEDDQDYDHDEWNPDFYASNAYVGGLPDEKTSSERTEFWDWFLEMKKKIQNDPSTIQTEIIN